MRTHLGGGAASFSQPQMWRRKKRWRGRKIQEAVVVEMKGGELGRT